MPKSYAAYQSYDMIYESYDMIYLQNISNRNFLSDLLVAQVLNKVLVKESFETFFAAISINMFWYIKIHLAVRSPLNCGIEHFEHVVCIYKFQSVLFFVFLCVSGRK